LSVFGTPVNTRFPYFFYRILDFKGVRFFIYSLIKCNITYLSFKIWDLLGVKHKNTSIFCYFDFIFNQKYIRVLYVFYDFYVKKPIFQSHFFLFFTYLKWEFLNAKYGFLNFRGEGFWHFFYTPQNPHFPYFFWTFYTFVWVKYVVFTIFYPPKTTKHDTEICVFTYRGGTVFSKKTPLKPQKSRFFDYFAILKG
jgi:hypothetical protein